MGAKREVRKVSPPDLHSKSKRGGDTHEQVLRKAVKVFLKTYGWALVQVPQDDFGDFEDAN